jgi:rhamnose utilization protein RhaD (predicted bifunctional aldolase and dehydrogenase)
MRNRPWPIDLDIFSGQIGRDFFMVQGPGGNTSFKDEKIMWIKASGTKLSNAEVEEIFVGVSVENGSTADPKSQLKPSIEKDFHLLIPFAYVIHTHSLRSLVMGIVQDFGARAKQFPEIAFVRYARPGRDLCNQLSQSIDFSIHKSAILQNHGFLTWGSTMEEAYSALLKYESGLETTITPETMAEIVGSTNDHPKAITPDYAVFLSSCNQSEILNFEGKDLWKKQMYLISQHACALAKHESEINYLSAEEVDSLQNWDAEKFRMSAN